jgi:hypothetical protein
MHSFRFVLRFAIVASTATVVPAEQVSTPVPGMAVGQAGNVRFGRHADTIRVRMTANASDSTSNKALLFQTPGSDGSHL